MSDLTPFEKRKLERALGMGSGYVMTFTNKSFAEFFEYHVGIDIYAEKYSLDSGSKANRMRAFWEKESNHLVGRVLECIISEWSEHRDPQSPELPPDDLVKVTARLKSGAEIPDISVVTAPGDDETFDALAKSVKAYIDKNEPELGLDRLHTYLIKYFRTLCERHGLPPDKEKPLHSLVGEYIKTIKAKSLIESEMTERILKATISVMESFNKVRNDHSLAHDNKILNYNESLLIFHHVTSSMKFIEAVESKAKSRQQPETEDATDDIPL